MGRKYRVIDLFAGVGGLSYGFAHDKMFEIIAANEILKPMATAYELNHRNAKVYNKDIKNFGIADIEKDFGFCRGDIDIIIGGPPCQAYSTVGKRFIGDPRAKLFQEYCRILEEFDPKLFVFENVKGLLSMARGELFSAIIDLFMSIGYRVEYSVLNAVDYGVPQIRERVFVVGSKYASKFEFPRPTHYNPTTLPLDGRSLLPHLTLKDAISDLALIESGGESFEYSCKPQNSFQEEMRINAPYEIMDHNAPNNGRRLVELMRALPDGGSPLDIPEYLRPKSGFRNAYCRLWWERPCTTVTRNFGTPSSSRCIHPRAPRPLTTREGARVQSFPDDYRFYGSKSDRNLQIGNAVPPKLSSAIKESVKTHILQACL